MVTAYLVWFAGFVVVNNKAELARGVLLAVLEVRVDSDLVAFFICDHSCW